MFSKLAVRGGSPGWVLTLAALLAAESFAAEALDLRHVPARAAIAVVAHPQQLSQSPELELLPWEVIQAGGQQEWGIDPLRVELAIGLLAAPESDSPPDWGLALYFSQPQQPAEKWLEQAEAVNAGPFTYRRLPGPARVSFSQPDPRTLLIGSESMLKDMLAASGAASPLRQLLADAPLRNDLMAAVAFSQLRAVVKQALSSAPPLPPPLQPLLKVPDQLETVLVAANLSSARVSGIKLIAVDEAAAQQLEQTLRQALAFGKQMLLGQLTQSMQGSQTDDAIGRGMQQYLVRLADNVESRLRPARTGKELLITLNADYATSGVLVALLLPAVQPAREAARRTDSLNNLKQLMLAMHNYHDTYRHFPATHSSDAAGKPLLSWRVHLLPFLEQQALYEKFHLNEPWDSPHNRQLLAQMPEVFRSPGSSAAEGKTTYLGVQGKDMVFIPPRENNGKPGGCMMREILDGTSNTVVLVDASDALAVEWTRPADYQPDPAQPMQGLVGRRPGGFLAALADGSVRFIAESIDPAALMRAYTRADGQPVRLD